MGAGECFPRDFTKRSQNRKTLVRKETPDVSCVRTWLLNLKKLYLLLVLNSVQGIKALSCTQLDVL